MITFFVCVAILTIGYFTYGTIVDRIIKPDDGIVTPAHRMADGVDYVKLPWWKVLLTQFLNIAGLGPIFGAISGAAFGPVAFIWITFGCLFIGSVHDILSGYVSMKHDGLSISELVGLYLGNGVKQFMRIFTLVLLLLVGVVFMMPPAEWLGNTIPLGFMGIESDMVWMLIIIAYFVLATILPINKLISKIFPLFSILMLVMCVLLFGGIMIAVANGEATMVEFTFGTVHPTGLAAMPFLLVTIACGAVSGFHATKSPMMARCIEKESETKRVFFGAMVIEGVVALIWAAVAMALVGDRFWGSTPYGVGAMGGPGTLVNDMSFMLLPAGLAYFLVIIAIILVPITSADTGFRSMRMLIGDALKLEQSSLKNRTLISIPIFAVAFALTFVDFDIIWRYFAWSNQTIAAIALWTGASWLAVNKKFHWIATLPATFLSWLSVAYILQAPTEGFGLDPTFSNIAGVVFAIALFGIFIVKAPSMKVKEYTLINKKSAS